MHVIHLVAIAFSSQAAHGVKVVVINRASSPARMQKSTVSAGEAWVAPSDVRAGASLKFKEPEKSAVIPDGRYAVIILDNGPALEVKDTNDFQVELSDAGHACTRDGASTDQASWAECLAQHCFEGFLPVALIKQAFDALWQDYSYWSLCNNQDPASSLREVATKAGHTIHVLREEPLVATVRNFLSPNECKGLMKKANFDALSRATVGAGGGKTATSESRETLTTNFFVNWSLVDPLSMTAAKSFDLVSELLGTNLSYEGQEPVNFLHYIKGYEYKPHTDGWSPAKGKRVATTLIYCEAAEQGGATIFPQGSPPLRFQPAPGDLLYFRYAPAPQLALHAACPVIKGKKSTLTQWYRVGVSPSEPWDLFEDWGRFHNPYASSRWPGPRFGDESYASTQGRALLQSAEAEIEGVPVEQRPEIPSEHKTSWIWICTCCGVIAATFLYLCPPTFGSSKKAVPKKPGKNSKPKKA